MDLIKVILLEGQKANKNLKNQIKSYPIYLQRH